MRGLRARTGSGERKGEGDSPLGILGNPLASSAVMGIGEGLGASWRCVLHSNFSTRYVLC